MEPLPFADEFALPPPRQVSPVVLRRIRRKTRGMWMTTLLVGFIFSLVGLPASLVFFPWHIRESLELKAGPSASSPGRISSVEGTSWNVNNRQVHVFHYTFAVGDEELSGRCYFAGGNYGEGCPVRVRYLISRPHLNCVEGGSFDPAGNTAAFVVTFPVIGVVFLIIGLWSVVSGGRLSGALAREGYLAEGRVTAVEKTSLRVNRRYRHRVTVSFDALGPREMTYAAYGPDVDRARHWMESNVAVRVLYDRRRPERAALLEHLLG